MKLIEKGWAVVDRRWRIMSDKKGMLIFVNKEDAEKVFLPDRKEMVVEAQIYIAEYEESAKDLLSN